MRFDGISFRLLEHDNTPSLPAGPILGLVVDAEGVLWVRMESPYLMRYRGGNFEQIYPLQVPAPFDPARERGATAAIRGTRGDVLIASPRGTSAIPRREIHANHFFGRGGWHSRYRSRKLPMAPSGLGCAIPACSRVRDGHGSQVTGLPDQKVNVLLPGAGPELWIGTDSGLVRWDGSAITRRGVPAALAHSPILALARDRDSNLWISTPAGITRMDSGGTTIQGTGEKLDRLSACHF